jgi:hypothetical protein
MRPKFGMSLAHLLSMSRFVENGNYAQGAWHPKYLRGQINAELARALE